MDLVWFCTLFIFQFIGHRIGDYLIQSNKQALLKATDATQRFDHCLSYSLAVSLPLLFIIEARYVLVIFFLTFIEHMIVDSRKPVEWWKTFFEQKIKGDKNFNLNELPFFVLIEIDQTFHLLRIFIISIIFAHIL